jgi:hypothetical protein
VIEATRRGYTRNMAAAFAGMGKTALYKWLAQDADFADACMRAGQEFACRTFEQLVERGEEKRDWRAGAWILERRFSDEWGPRQHVQAEVQVSSSLDGIEAAQVLAALRLLAGEEVV